MRWELKAGLLIFAVTLTASVLVTVPEFVMGFGLGLALCFELTGILPDSVRDKIKGFKKSLIKRGSYKVRK